MKTRNTKFILITLSLICVAHALAANLLAATLNPPTDFDGDGKSDIGVFRPSDGFWYVKKSTGGFISTQWGKSGDKPLAGDYDGDGKADFMVCRLGLPFVGFTAKNWYLRQSSDGRFITRQLGGTYIDSSDLALSGDYNGDGRTDLAIYYKSTDNNPTFFRVLQTSDETSKQTYWGTEADFPVPADYDGDGKTDYAVYRNDFISFPTESLGYWYILQSSTGTMRVENFGLATDLPVPADYDGDGKVDIAVYRASQGIWYRLNSSNGAFSATQFGNSLDIAAPADYDGDRKADIAVYRPTEGNWYLLQSTLGFKAERFGLNGDIPLSKASIY